MPTFHNFDGRYFGYVRVSTEDQTFNMQTDALIAAGVPEERVIGFSL